MKQDTEKTLGEDINTIDAELKKNENYSVPDTLSVENVMNTIQNTDIGEEKKTDNISKKKLTLRIIACAAMFTLIISAAIIFPLRNSLFENQSVFENGKHYADSYEEIEQYFLSKTVELEGDVISKGDSNISIDASATYGSLNTDASNKNEISEANDQVEGVSESDIFINDGEYIYTISETNGDGSKNQVAISSVDSQGNISIESQILSEESDGNESFIELEVYNDYVIVISHIYNETVRTKASIYSVKDINRPELLKSFVVDGYYITSRLTGDKLIVVSNYNVNIFKGENQRENCIPKYCYNDDFSRVSLSDIYIIGKEVSTSYCMTESINLSNFDDYHVKAVLGGSDNVFCSTDYLYTASSAYRFFDEEDNSIDSDKISTEGYSNSEIVKIDLKNNLNIVGTATVQGTVLNQFSMDEYDGYFRIATTDNNWINGTTENYVFVIDEKMNIVGKIDGLAEGEEIKSVRFSEETGYVVTFENTDPLFVIDLSDPKLPVIQGSVELPGFSSYLQKISDGLLIGIGYGGDENGADNSLKVSLFDINDDKNPIEICNYVVNPERINYSSNMILSEVWYDHKALCYDKINHILYIPYIIENEEQFIQFILEINIDVVNKNFSLVEEKEIFSLKDEFGSIGITRIAYIGDIMICLNPRINTLYTLNKKTYEILDSLSLAD